MRLEDEVGLARDPYPVGDEVVRKHCRIFLVVGLVGVSLVYMRQRLPDGWRGFGSGGLGLGSIR